MGKRDAQILAFVHFTVTELRPLWLLWYTVYNTFESIVTGASVSDAYLNTYILKCLYDEKMIARDIENCAKSAYKRYLAHGPQFPYKECNQGCPGSGVGIDVPEPRSMFYFMTVWLFGFVLVLLVYCIYRQPNYHTGSYIKFTQTLYASKVYRIAAFSTFVVSFIIITIGIYLLIKYGKGWTQYIVALILMVMASRSLIRDKSNGLNISSEAFCHTKISRGNTFMMVINFFFTTNAALLDEVEIQFMKKLLPEDLAAPKDPQTGWSAFFTYDPLIETTNNSGGIATKGGDNDTELPLKV